MRRTQGSNRSFIDAQWHDPTQIPIGFYDVVVAAMSAVHMPRNEGNAFHEPVRCGATDARFTGI
jgi:hypothetical protein